MNGREVEGGRSQGELEGEGGRGGGGGERERERERESLNGSGDKDTHCMRNNHNNVSLHVKLIASFVFNIRPYSVGLIHHLDIVRFNIGSTGNT